jgi:sulfide dehydrogenase cytochrome subunit
MLRLICCLITLAWLFPTPAFPADLTALTPVCNGCHGDNGVSVNNMVPTIAGQPFTLIEDNLLAFRDGERACDETPFMKGESVALVSAMCAVVGTLGDNEITLLAEFYEQQTFEPAIQSFDPDLATRGFGIHQEGGCELCHSNGGRESNGMSAILAGQWTPYLERSLLRIRAGERAGPKVMNRAIRDLSDTDLAALVNYYASP